MPNALWQNNTLILDNGRQIQFKCQVRCIGNLLSQTMFLARKIRKNILTTVKCLNSLAIHWCKTFSNDHQWLRSPSLQNRENQPFSIVQQHYSKLFFKMIMVGAVIIFKECFCTQDTSQKPVLCDSHFHSLQERQLIFMRKFC